MPIVILPSEDSPLSQGDILKGLRLYSTKGDWDNQDEPGGRSQLEKFELCLVLSRPCVLQHKPDFIAAAINVVKEAPPVEVSPEDKVEAYKRVKAFLERLRDGIGRPDRFYLGQLPNLSAGRYYAQLDSLHSISKPPAEKLPELLRKHRIGTLSGEFCRDLHVRVFSAFANLGFNDAGWLSDADLQWIVNVGRQAVLAKEGKLQEQRTVLSQRAASGEQPPRGQLDNEQKHLVKLEQERTVLCAEVSEYENELARRSPQTDSLNP